MTPPRLKAENIINFWYNMNACQSVSAAVYAGRKDVEHTIEALKAAKGDEEHIQYWNQILDWINEFE